VGIFSFLTGKKDPREESESAPAAGVGVGPHAMQEKSAATAEPDPLAAAAPTPAPHPPIAADHAPSAESPFQAPDAWNIDALTAPKPEQTGDKPEIGPVDPAVTAELQPQIVEAMKTVYDPEIPVDIYELGLIYGIDVDADRRVLVKMTLTSPACPSAQQLPSEVRYKVKAIPGVTDAWVDIVWEPPWDKDRMSEAAKLQLGFF
jgi:FeS assembly SUF system protein